MVFVQIPEIAAVLAFRTTAEGQSDLIVLGPRTRGSYHPDRPALACVQVRLRPGQARELLGVPVDRLVDRAVRLTGPWAALAAELSGGDAASIRVRLTAELKRHTATGRAGDLVAAAVEELAGPTRLPDVAGRIGVSERRLRTLFTREVGLSPKHVARISRLRTVLSLAGRREWAAVADDAGFFDQAHMISDFRALMGVSPGAYLSGRLPAASPCTRLQQSVAPDRPSSVAPDRPSSVARA